MKIGETFLSEGVISADQLQMVLDEQEKTHDRLGDIVLRKGFSTPHTIAPALAKYFQIPFINIKQKYKSIPADVFELISPELAVRYNVIPVEKKDNSLTLAMFDPLDLTAIDAIRMKTGLKIKCALASYDDIKEAVEYCYHGTSRMREHIENYIDKESNYGQTPHEKIPEESFDANDQPVVQYVQSLIVQAVSVKASDIHLQPKEIQAELRFRIDGILHPHDPPPKAMLAAINTRIKIMAGLDIAEKRLPQDGRFKVNVGKKQIDLRVSSFPTIYGESVVMRLLDTSAPLLGLEQLGFAPRDLENYRKILAHPYGLILVTGPTGSGKTTTLYTSLNEIKSEVLKIITLEDPVEYRLEFIQQSQVNPNIGFDFTRGLRSILRQDPDVIMVGEIRDQETAEIAINAALTGHLVLSTLHTNDAAGAAVRLIKMGVEPFLIASSLLGVVGQRLLRTICPDCRESHPIDQALMEKFSINGEFNLFYRGRGCEHCRQTGYSGRKGIYEFLIPNEEIRQMVLKCSSSDEIKRAAQKNGMRTLRQVGIENFLRGVTTPEELLRVTRETEEVSDAL